MGEHTPTPWNWVIHDHSMASLGAGDSPGLGDPLVLAVAPCDACAGRADPKEWKWGRCHTPSEADADFILTAVNSHDALVKALQEVVRDIKEYERMNNLAPNPPRMECWDSVARAKDVLVDVGSACNFRKDTK